VNRHYSEVADRAGHRCEYCHAPEAIFNFPFEVEHITPTSRKGPDDESNLALACRSCNLHKSNAQSKTDEVTGTKVELFHPRKDRWSEHFQADSESGEIRALTPTARVTVDQLRLNSPLQLAARRMWLRLGIYSQRN
jgi:hypothetical protein